jgi:hypothetical protein
VIVAGRKIVEDGVVIGVDLPQIERELTSYYKTNLSRYDQLECSWPTIETEIARWFVGYLGCS